MDSPDFITVYEAIKAPDTTVYRSDAEAESAQNTFLRRVRNSLGLSRRAMQSFFDEEAKLLLPSAKEATLHRGDPDFEMAEHITLLRHRGHQILASVMLTREEESRDAVLHFAKYPLTDASELVIRELHIVEALEAGFDHEL